MLRVIARPVVYLVERWLPGPLILAIVLTVIAAVAALTMTDTTPGELVMGWGEGLIGLLAFMTQVCLVLLLGYTLANTHPVHRLLVRIAGLPKTPAAAYGFVTVVAGLASLISFGLGLVVGGVMAVEVARAARQRGMKLHYPLLVASGYSGFVIWHMGYSGSGPLNAATDGGAYTDLPGGLIEITRTTFSWWNITAAFVTLAVVTVAMMLMTPKRENEIVTAPDAIFALPGGGGGGAGASADAGTGTGGDAAGAHAQTGEVRDGARTPAEWMEHFRGFTALLGVFFGIYLVMHFGSNGFDLNLDIVNWTLLCLILLLVGNARELASLVAEGGRTVSEVLLQYPLYAGLIGMMSASGLTVIVSEFFIDISSPATLGFFAFLAAGVLNMFIPSGGGQFEVMAPLFAAPADALGVQQEVVVMAIAYGDQWTNMIQPFWAIPLLAVAGLKVREILGYTTITLILSGITLGGTMLLVGAG
ncbi:short-chain fatty acid transporter [Brevibacterium salitolerans]|uniref:Short-chain fatty acid transporter n=1 Tax=Brevibacterium salitolerans TaxID=1403566 RepID=A0ABN2WTL4_9MICO